MNKKNVHSMIERFSSLYAFHKEDRQQLVFIGPDVDNAFLDGIDRAKIEKLKAAIDNAISTGSFRVDNIT